MPIETTRVEAGVYLNRWIGHITLDDILASEREGERLITPDEKRIVLVNDLSAATRLPLDLKALRRIAELNPQIIALLVVNAPALVRMAGEAQAKLVSWRVEFFDSLDVALERARSLYSHNDGTQTEES